MNETNIKPKQLAICFLCDKPYTKLYKKKRYCRVHLHKKLGIVTKPKKKLSDEEKEQYLDLYSDDDNEHYLGVRSYKMERIQNTIDDIARGETERRTVSVMSEFVTDSIRDSLSSYYKNNCEPAMLAFPIRNQSALQPKAQPMIHATHRFHLLPHRIL